MRRGLLIVVSSASGQRDVASSGRALVINDSDEMTAHC